MIYLTHAHTACTESTQLLDDVDYPQYVHWFPESYAKIKTGLFYAPHVVINKVLNKETCDAIKASPCKTAFLFASGNSTLAGATSQMGDSQLSSNYKVLPLTLTQVFAGRTAMQFGEVHLVQTDASACASSLKVLSDVKYLMEHKKFKRVIVLSGEDQVSNMTLKFFGECNASLVEKDRNGKQPSAFDEKNGAFFVGQGAALAVFETEDALTAKPIAKLLGCGVSAELCSNPIGQSDDGEGFYRAIQESLGDAEIYPHEVTVVKTHGTGTAMNNRAEKTALNAALTSFVATSYKPSIGHTMGASGLLESILLIKSLRNGVVPAIKNRTEIDNVFLSEDKQTPEEGYMLSLAAGMGNIYAAAIFDWRV